MGPIDYTSAVVDPLTRAMQGYAEKVQAGQQDRALNMDQQRLDMAQSAMMAEQRAAEEARAKAAQDEAAQRAFAEYLIDPAKTYEKTVGMVKAYPQFAEQVVGQWQGMNADQQAGTAKFARQLTYALGSGNVDGARMMLEERAAAAEAAGDQEGAATYKASLEALKMGDQGVQTVLGMGMASLAGVLEPDDMKKHSELVFGKTPEVAESVAALQQRAELGGLKPGTPEYAKFMLDGGKASGFGIRTNPDGSVEIVQGGATADIFGGKPPTEGQLAAAGFLQRMTASEDIFAGLEAKGVNAIPTLKTPVVGGAAEGYVLSGEEASLLQAQRDWVRAKLRKESGAVIGDEEMASEIKTYFPMPGDAPEVIAQKRQARIRAQRQMQITSGPAAVLAEARDQEPQGMDDASFIAAMKAKRDRGEPPTEEEKARIAEILASRGGQ